MKIKLIKRVIVGKQAKTLRQQNLVPANIYGPSRESANVALTPKEFRRAFQEAGYNRLIDVEIEGEEKSVKVLFKEVQSDPILETPIHISFYQVDMTKPINTTVPVVIEGVSPAVKNNIGLLVNPFDSLRIMCLPGDIPEQFVVDINKLDNIGDSIHISDIELPENVKWESSVDDRAAVVYIAAPQKTIEEEEAEEAATKAAEEPAEGTEGSTTEGADGAEADATVEAKKE
ncbi:50S ribosomal protein L25 [Candidatus Dojkabacteria bacterium]|nr:50S ribosomal protein L25 [Candidatus Dojkabacteria bacterium]